MKKSCSNSFSLSALSFFSLLASWLTLWAVLAIGGSIYYGKAPGQAAYWWRLAISIFFFIGMVLAMSFMLTSRHTVRQKAAFTCLITVHYCSLLSLLLLEGGTDIPLGQIGIFLISGGALFILGLKIIIRERKIKDT